jgi:nucleotide-binding universal stress UspA family protein
VDKLEKIVVPVDFSPLSKQALRAALVMSRKCGLEVHLLHVIPEYEIDSAFHIQLPERREIESEAGRWADKVFEKFLRGEEVGSTALVKAVRYGKPARVIGDYAAEEGADLVLLASHGRSGFERTVFGSVAEKVLRTCPLPVLVVKSGQ